MSITDLIQNNDLEGVKKYIEDGGDVNFITDDRGEKLTVLEIASNSGNFEIVKYLIEAGADVNFLGNVISPLIGSILSQKIEIVKYIVEAGADINRKVYDIFENNTYEKLDMITPAQLANKTGKYEIVKYLIEKGFYNINSIAGTHSIKRFEDIPTEEEYRNAFLDYFEFLKYILNFNIDINKRNKHGKTVIHNVIETLTNYTHRFYEWRDSEEQPEFEKIHINIKKTESIKIIKFLIDHGVDVNITNNEGKKPLHIAKDPDIKAILAEHENKNSWEFNVKSLEEKITSLESIITDIQGELFTSLRDCRNHSIEMGDFVSRSEALNLELMRSNTVSVQELSNLRERIASLQTELQASRLNTVNATNLSDQMLAVRNQLADRLEELNNNPSTVLGRLISEVSIFSKLSSTNKYQILLLNALFEDIRNLQDISRVNELRLVFQNIRDSVRNHSTSVLALDSLIDRGFKVGIFSQGRLRTDLFV